MPPSLEKQVKVWHLLAGIAITALTSAFTWGNAWRANLDSVSQLTAKVETVERKVQNHDEDIKQIRQTTTETANDVKWIVRSLKGDK